MSIADIYINLNKYKNRVIRWLFAGLILVLSLRNLAIQDQIIIISDEFGYWGNIDHIFRGDWSGFISRIPYYSAGYSLLLAPIAAVAKSGRMAYRLAIGLNGLLAMLAFLIAGYCVRKIIGSETKLSDTLCDVVCFVCIMSGSNLYQTQFTWTEIPMVFMMWSSIALLLCFEETKHMVCFALFLLSFSYMVWIHQRAAALIPVVLIILFMTLKKTKNRKFVLGMTLLSVFIITGLLSLFWNTVSEAVNSQSLIEQEAGIFILLTKHNQLDAVFFQNFYQRLTGNIGNVLYSVCGKIYVLLFMSMGVCLLPFVSVIKQLMVVVKSKEKKPYMLTLGYICLSAVAMMCATAIQCSKTTRLDVIVYSRYMDFAWNPMMAIGLALLVMSMKKYIASYVVSILIFCITSIPTMLQYNQSTGYFNTPCSPVIGAWVRFLGGHMNVAEGDGTKIFLCTTVVGIYVMGTILIGLCFGAKKSSFYQKNIIIVAVFAVIFCFNAFVTINSDKWIKEYHNAMDQNCDKLVETIQKYELNAYYMGYQKGDTYCHFGQPFQFLLWDKSLNVWEDDYSEIPEEQFLLVVENKSAKKYKLMKQVRSDSHFDLLCESGAASLFLYTK